ncbi:MAG TPA: DUF3418 domain-containing protein, partial [Steroidobacteraceae bacterium]|nr:DUF3418 domain-containing protein [Steroidobacteraceae bacterium]
ALDPQTAHPVQREGISAWDFDTLPEQVTSDRQDTHLELYPALEDRADCVALVLYPDAERARSLTRAGVLRLLSLALGSNVRSLVREIGRERELLLLHHAVGETRRLPLEIVERALQRISLPADMPTPRSRAEFDRMREHAAQGLPDAARGLAAQVQATLAQNLVVMRALDALPVSLDATLVEDVRRARARLIHPGFVAQTPDPWLDALPRYLRALERRVAKLPGAQAAAARAQQEMHQRWQRYEALDALTRSLTVATPPALLELRWLLEEYAVSLFAQELKTAVTVSAKRLDEAQAAARRALEALA